MTPTKDERWWRCVRCCLWRALKNDDPQLLMTGLLWFGGDRDMGTWLEELELQMWREGNGFRNSGQRIGLLAIAAGNNKGIPGAGARSCVKALLKLPHRPEQWRLALQRARRFRNRRAICRLLMNTMNSPT